MGRASPRVGSTFQRDNRLKGSLTMWIKTKNNYNSDNNEVLVDLSKVRYAAQGINNDEVYLVFSPKHDMIIKWPAGWDNFCTFMRENELYRVSVNVELLRSLGLVSEDETDEH